MTKVLVVGGKGQIGAAIVQIEEEAGHEVYIAERHKKPDPLSIDVLDVMHICLPYNDQFDSLTSEYLYEYNPKLTIIHSTVPVGTTAYIEESTSFEIVHSPVRGIHPNLYGGIKTFVKYVGGSPSAVEKALKYYEEIGLKGHSLGTSQHTEMAKILSTTYYGWCILYTKQVAKLCDRYGLDFDAVYTHPNTTYNEGYVELDKPNVVRPVLFPPEGKIGGHCVSQNFELLPDSPLKIMAKELNENDG